MERHDILARAATWMQARGWRQKLARRRDSEQTLINYPGWRSR